MRSLLDRVRWLAAPLAAYLVITLILPAVHGAARRGRFLHHAGWVLAGCAAAIAAAALVDHTAPSCGGAAGPEQVPAVDGLFANKPPTPRVPSSGGSP